MSFNLKSVIGFLGHHVNDLGAIADVLEGVVGALPVNAETRHNINQSIEHVRTSAGNVKASLTKLGVSFDPPALDTDEALRRLIAEYMAAHPNASVAAAQVATDMRTANTAAHDEPTRTGATTTVTSDALQEGRDATPGAMDKVAGKANTGTANSAPDGAPVNKDVPAEKSASK